MSALRPSPAPPATALVGAALVTLMAAAIVLIFGVVATSGVYGSRMAWLLGVVLPLLVTSMLLSRLGLDASAGAQARPDAPLALPARGRHVGRVVFTLAAAAIGLPLALAVALLTVDALLFAVHGITVLL